MLNKLYLWSKKVHRLLVLVIVALGLIMTISGSALRFPRTAASLGMDLALIRELHGSISVYFALSFLAMVLTGLVMYLFPYLKKWGASKG